MLPPLESPVCQAVHVPSGVAVFPARTSMVTPVPAGVVAVKETVVKLDGDDVSKMPEVKVPEVKP